jgi:hypothetical protein
MRRAVTTALLLLCLSGAGSYGQRKTPVVRQVDRVLVESKDPQTLFSFFADTLQLPVAWPMNQNQSYSTGGVGAGNVNIELFAYSGSASPKRTRYCGIAFEPYPLGDALRRLQFLSIPYDKPAPVMSTLPNGSNGVAWTTVALPTLSKPGMSIFLYEYSPSFLKVDIRRKQLGNRLMLNRGGPLGLRALDEILIGSTTLKKDLSAWSLMIGKLTDSGSLHPINGPAIRIIADSADQIREITFRVESLSNAKSFLAKSKLLGAKSGNRIYLNSVKLQGLRVALTDQ